MFTDGSAVQPVPIQQCPAPEARVQVQPSSDSNPPTVYLFEQGDCAHIRESGIPEVTTRMCASFEPEPAWAWLDDREAWDSIPINVKNDWFVEIQEREKKDGFELSVTTGYVYVNVCTAFLTLSEADVRYHTCNSLLVLQPPTSWKAWTHHLYYCSILCLLECILGASSSQPSSLQHKLINDRAWIVVDSNRLE